MDRAEILSETDEPYPPKIGNKDDTVRPKPGTVIRMKSFDFRRVPKMPDFERQLAQRFGVRSPSWQIVLKDSTKTSADPEHERIVGEFAVGTMADTKIRFEAEKINGKEQFKTYGPDGKEIVALRPGFCYEDEFYPVVGWVAYSDKPYKDDLMAGVRIYCRGKIVAQTHVFNLRAGFTGEHDVRSYLVGELHADWLDQDEDLVRTDRQDILWSNALGYELEKWGRSLVKRIGALTREPKRKKAWARFKEVSSIEERVTEAFPRNEQKDIREAATEIARHLARTTSTEELEDPEHIESLVKLCLLLGPHITLDEKLREAAEDAHGTVSLVSTILKTARVAELSAFGRIAENRVKVITRVDDLKDDPTSLESAFQDLIQEAPWLIDPQWSPVTANQNFTTLREEFEKFYERETGEAISLQAFSDLDKRADFVLINQDTGLEIIEIKRPAHGFSNEEMTRMNRYKELMESFLAAPGNAEFATLFPHFQNHPCLRQVSSHRCAPDSF